MQRRQLRLSIEVMDAALGACDPCFKKPPGVLERFILGWRSKIPDIKFHPGWIRRYSPHLFRDNFCRPIEIYVIQEEYMKAKLVFGWRSWRLVFEENGQNWEKAFEMLAGADLEQDSHGDVLILRCYYWYERGWEQPSVGHCRRVLFMEHPLTKRWSFHWNVAERAWKPAAVRNAQRCFGFWSCPFQLCHECLSVTEWTGMKIATGCACHLKSDLVRWRWQLGTSFAVVHRPSIFCFEATVETGVYLYKCSCAKRVLYDKQWKKLGVSFLIHIHIIHDYFGLFTILLINITISVVLHSKVVSTHLWNTPRATFTNRL